ncbi:MAG: multicopper oxidase domain-containing protein [Steroidobacteraceae bacterium]
MSTEMKTSGAWLVAMLLVAPMTQAAVSGISGTPCAGASACFDLQARAGHIALGDGNSLLTWGYGVAGSDMQYPGPTLIVNQGDTVQVTLTNTDIPLPVSIVFPGQVGVNASGGTTGLITNEVATGGGTVTYTFTASNAGTYMYQSGSTPELEVEMGMVGALIVRPSGFNAASPHAYNYGTVATAYDREFLFFLSDMDRRAHAAVETTLQAALAAGTPITDDLLVAAADPAAYAATLWFINGRNGPDTMHPDNIGWLPRQPYGALARMHPGERTLMRIVGAGRDLHPFHHHGNNAWLIARDGRVLGSGDATPEAPYPDFLPRPPVAPLANPDLAPGGVTSARLPDLATSNYTVQVVPGSTYDAIFTWTGLGLNWDIYGNRPGHSPSDCGAREPNEDPNSHCKAIPVVLPEQQSLTFGGLWSGSAYLGTLEALPPNQGGLNPAGGFSYMWHSHTERELTNDDIFPGGMMTMMIIEGPEVPLD